MECHIYDKITKDFDLYLISRLSLFPSWLVSSTKQPAKLEKPMKQETGAGLWATACKELGDANNHMSLKVLSFFSQALR